MSKIIIGGEGFPGSLSAKDFCDITSTIIKGSYPHDNILTYPLASGNKGTILAFQNYLEGKMRNVPINNTLVNYFLSQNLIGVIEGSNHQDLNDSTAWGILIKDALINGATTIYLALKNETWPDQGTGLLNVLINTFDQNYFLEKDISFFGLGDAKTHVPESIKSFLKIKMMNGAQTILSLSKISDQMKGSNLLITSMGDTLDDELTTTICEKAKELTIPQIILVGRSSAFPSQTVADNFYILTPDNMPLDIALKELPNNLRFTLMDLIRQDII